MANETVKSDNGHDINEALKKIAPTIDRFYQLFNEGFDGFFPPVSNKGIPADQLSFEMGFVPDGPYLKRDAEPENYLRAALASFISQAGITLKRGDGTAGKGVYWSLSGLTVEKVAELGRMIEANMGLGQYSGRFSDSLRAAHLLNQAVKRGADQTENVPNVIPPDRVSILAAFVKALDFLTPKENARLLGAVRGVERVPPANEACLPPYPPASKDRSR